MPTNHDVEERALDELGRKNLAAARIPCKSCGRPRVQHCPECGACLDSHVCQPPKDLPFRIIHPSTRG
jgi:hypothetical protein